MYCKVAVSIPVDQLYTYKIPDKYSGLVTRGSRVLVNIKNQADPVAAYVISCCETCDYDPTLVKPVYDIVEGAPLPEDLLMGNHQIEIFTNTGAVKSIKSVIPAETDSKSDKK